MYTKTQSRFFPKLLTAILTGSLLLSACAPAPTATNLPTNTMIPATGDPTQMPVPPLPSWQRSPTASHRQHLGDNSNLRVADSRRAAGSSQRSERQ